MSKEKIKTFVFGLSSTQDYSEVAEIEIEAKTEDEAREIYEENYLEYVAQADWKDNGLSGDCDINLEEVYEK